MLSQSLEEVDSADDLCLMARKYQHMHEKVDDLACEARRLRNSQISTEPKSWPYWAKNKHILTLDLQHCFSCMHVR